MSDPVLRDERLVVTTPEGVELSFSMADHGSRAAAFLVDLFLMFLAVLLIVFVTGLSSVGSGAGWLSAIGFFFFFVLRQFYFAFFEIRWHGQTPGKRRQGIRVIEASGGALRPEAILARNLTRDLEVFLPLTLVAAPESIFPGVTGWARAAAAVWGLIFALLPLLNRQRLRVGDLVGGTRVVAAPKSVLLGDLGSSTSKNPVTSAPAALFSPEMLTHYGIFELQKLEEVLRSSEAGELPGGVLDEVCERIRRRIGFPKETRLASLEFLRAFYAAQRAQLEDRAVMGERISDKDAARARGPKKPRAGR